MIVPGTRRIVPVVWVGVGLAALQQFVGINIIFYFGEVLWKAAGASEQLALNINLLTAVINILATIPAIMPIDRVGRKPLLLYGSIGMALALCIFRPNPFPVQGSHPLFICGLYLIAKPPAPAHS